MEQDLLKIYAAILRGPILGPTRPPFWRGVTCAPFEDIESTL
jgi:hypothetical protein